MKKFKNARAEINFVLTAPLGEVMPYATDYPFYASTQSLLAEHGMTEALQVQIEMFGIRPSALRVVLQKEDELLIKTVLVWQSADNNTMRILFNEGPYEIIRKNLNRKYPQLPEQEMLERFDEEELRSAINGPEKLSLFAKCDILSRGSEDLVDLVIKRGGLGKREKMVAIHRASEEGCEYLIAQESNTKLKRKLNKIYRKRQYEINLILSKQYHKLSRLTAKKRLCPKAEELFLAIPSPINDVELLYDYVCRYHPQGGDRAILSHPDRSKVIEYLSKNELDTDGEDLLMKRGKSKEIKAYIKMHSLSPKNQVRLIERGKHCERRRGQARD